MKRRDQRPATPARPAPPRPEKKPAGRRWWLIGSLAVLAVLGGGGTWAWRQHTTLARRQAALPAVPDLTGKATVLAGLLAQAQAQTRSAHTLLDGVQELGRLYHANNFPREAEACWQFLRNEQPREPRWVYYLADLRRSASDQAGLTALLQETLGLAPDYSPARLQLANLQLKSGEPEAAARNYRQRLEALPGDPYARLGLVRLALQAGRTDEARALLEQLLQDAPTFSTGHNLYAEILAAAGDAAGAARHRWLGLETLRYREAADPWLDELQGWCHDYDRLCVLGTLELQTENLDRAEALFARAIKLEPGNPQAYELQGSLFFKRKDPAKVRDLLEQALPRLNAKKSPAFFITLSQAYRQMKEPAEALRVARLGLAQAGEQPELYDTLGQVLADAGRHEEAVAAWQTGLAKNPGDAGMNYHQARSFLALQRLDDALAALDRSLTLQPTYLPTLLLRGQIELESGHLEAAAQYLQPAFGSHPEDPRARRLLAEWHRQMAAAAEAKNDPAAAEQHYRDGLLVDGDHAESLISLGVFYLVHDRFPEAIPPLVSYHRVQPENVQGCLFLGQAYAAAGQRDQARAILEGGLQLAEKNGQTTLARHCRRLLEQL